MENLTTLMDAELDDGFELEFVASNLDRVEQYGDATRFSPRQQKVIADLADKYLGEGRGAEMFGQLRFGGI